jgi:SAM-dependent methyltransferase
MEFARGCGIDFKLGTADNTLPFADNYFDMVMLHGVLEHLHDSPRDSRNDLLYLVKDEGLIFITVPNAVNIRKRVDVLFGRTNLPPFPSYYWYLGPWRGHVREYVKKDLLLLARYLDCQVVELRGCDRMLDKLPRHTRSIYLGCTSVFEGWKDSWLLVAKEKSGWAPRKAPPEGETVRRNSDE